MLIRGRVNFAQESENVENRYDITFSIHELTEKGKEDVLNWLHSNGIKVKEYQPKGGSMELQVRCTMFDNCPVTFINDDERQTVKYKALPLIYGDLCVFKCFIGEYTYRGKKGNALRCSGVALLKQANRGGFTDDEIGVIFG